MRPVTNRPALRVQRERLRAVDLFAIIYYMRRREFLGGFELLVLSALMRLGDDAYGVPIAEAIVETSRREVALGSVYVTLDRLSRKGLVTSRMGEPTAERGGRAKTYFRITAQGLREVRQARQTFNALWDGVPQLEGGMP
jgi:DNA-binding PadR family transcriptional regulator